MFLIVYDINAKRDPHGIRIRLVRALRRAGALQIQRSVWITESITTDLSRIVDEFRRAGGKVKLSEWLPRSLGEVSSAEGQMRKLILAVNGAEPLIEKWHVKLGKIFEGIGYTVEVKPVSWSAMVEYSKLTGERSDCLSMEKSTSRLLDEIVLDDLDALVILNSGRTSQSGIIYVAQTLFNTKVLKNMTSLPVIQVESLGKPDSAVVVWNDSGRRLAEEMRELPMPVVTPSTEFRKVTVNGTREIRQIQYAEVGDLIIVNGKKVGECLSDKVYVVAEGGSIVDIMGGRLFRIGRRLKLGSLREAIIKTVPKDAKRQKDRSAE
ncbi:MAG: DUF2117 domain-containing protein [Candidatus Methanosuratus sp.]|nr:DUF2117 domain-containing protein [Candidatus Methanosuratincola sp.]